MNVSDKYRNIQNDKKYVIIHITDDIVCCAEKLKVYSRPIIFQRSEFELLLIRGIIKQIPDKMLSPNRKITYKGTVKLDSDWKIIKFIHIENIALYVNEITRNDLLLQAEKKFNTTRQRINHVLQRYYWNGFTKNGLLDARYFNNRVSNTEKSSN